MDQANGIDNYDHHFSDTVYVANSIPGPGANIDDFEAEFIQGCACVQVCLTNCICTRGHSNYVSDTIKETQQIIMECNTSCACDENCGNRVVQKGPLNCLVVKETNKGLGLFTTECIKKGQFICEYAGEIIGLEEATRRIQRNKSEKLMNYVLVVSEYIGKKKITTCIDPGVFGNIGRYANHSCEPCAVLVPVRTECMIPRLCIFATTDIEKMCEITFDYAAGADPSSQKFSDTKCLCGSKSCLGYLPCC